jgi:single-strand DNA-binding protein
MYINNVVLQGNLVSDPNLITAKSGNDFLKLRMGVNDKIGEREETLFMNVLVFGKQATALNEFLTKGRNVTVKGRITNDDYENKEGVTVRSFSVIADRVSLGPRKDKNKVETSAPTNEVEEAVKVETPF